jgi:hypothetical protein
MGLVEQWNQLEPDLLVQNYFFYLMYVHSSFAYYHHLVIEISLGLAQSDPIKQRLM